MWNFKNKCCVYRVENAAQATQLPLVLGVKQVQAPLGGPSARLTSFNEATRPTARCARNNHAWHHYSQLKYLQSCVERVGNFRHAKNCKFTRDLGQNKDTKYGIAYGGLETLLSGIETLGQFLCPRF